MILIVTEADDPTADQVAARLEARGARYFRCAPSQFPRDLELVLALSSTGAVRAALHQGEHAIDLRQVRAAWYRRPKPPVPPEEIEDERVRRYVASECRTAMNDLWETLDCAWVPGKPALVQRAESKPYQLMLAGELGFEVPPTLITTRRNEILELYREHNGRLVSKLASPAFTFALSPDLARYTEPVTTRDVAYADRLKHGPAIFQPYVEKRVELRVTVVGTKVLAAEIDSQATSHTRFDWRRYDLGNTPHRPYPLPDDVAERCLALTRRLGLSYGAIDFIVTPDGRYVFIEINPNGQYSWIEECTGLPITDALCDLLMAGASS